MFGKVKRILALVGVILLAGLYLVSLVLSFMNSPAAKDWLKVSLVMTVLVPVMLFALILVYRILKK